MNQGTSLVEFLCINCGFQGLNMEIVRADECPKCRGKIITLEREETPNTI